MSIKVIDTLSPLGNFPVAESKDIDCDGTALNTVLSSKTTKSYVDTETAKKVDKVAGKGLSTNDYDNAEKSKVTTMSDMFSLSESKNKSKYEITSDKTQNPVTTTTYIKHGDKWLDAVVNALDDGYVTPQEYYSGTGNYDTAIASAITNSNGKTVYFPKIENGYPITNPIVITNNVNIIMDSPIVYSGTGTAITIGKPDTVLYGMNLKLSVKRSSDEYSTSSTGINLINIIDSNIDISYVRDFGNGIVFTGDGNAFADNSIKFGNTINCITALTLNAINNGWVNENAFYGGHFQVYTNFTHRNTSVGIKITSGNAYYNNNNNFYNTDLEQNKTAIHIVYGKYNNFVNVRTENCTLALKAENASKLNSVIIGYGVDAAEMSMVNDVKSKETKSNIASMLPFTILDTGFLPEKCASNATYISGGNMCRIGMESYSPTYVTKYKNYISITRGKHVAFCVDTFYSKLIGVTFNEPFGENTARFRIVLAMYDSSGAVIEEKPMGYTGSDFYKTTLNDVVCYTSGTGYPSRSLVYIKLPESCVKCFVAFHNTDTDESKITRVCISGKSSGYAYGTREIPTLDSIPTSEARIGDVCYSSNDNVKYWTYTSNGWTATSYDKANIANDCPYIIYDSGFMPGKCVSNNTYLSGAYACQLGNESASAAYIVKHNDYISVSRSKLVSFCVDTTKSKSLAFGYTEPIGENNAKFRIVVAMYDSEGSIIDSKPEGMTTNAFYKTTINGIVCYQLGSYLGSRSLYPIVLPNNCVKCFVSLLNGDQDESKLTRVVIQAKEGFGFVKGGYNVPTLNDIPTCEAKNGEICHSSSSSVKYWIYTNNAWTAVE